MGRLNLYLAAEEDFKDKLISDLSMAVSSQYIGVSSRHGVHRKLAPRCLSVPSQESWAGVT